MKKTFLKYISQLFLIVFSVVLGLFLSERIEERKKKKEANKLLSRITSEVHDNKVLLEKWTPYHRSISNRLDSLAHQDVFIENFIKDKTTLFKKVLTKGTFMGRMPSRDAWDIAKSHPLIVNLDYDKLLTLSRVYNQQESTFGPAEKITELFFSPDFNSKANAKTNLQKFKSLIKEVVAREKQLVQFYIDAEKVLKLEAE